MEIKATDLSARLLATENLSVVRGRVRTASFDIKSRVLTLPLWKDMTPEVEDMLIGHEVGHALYTSEEYIKPIMENRKLMGYMNIIEDVRIEKLIKRKYPGLRKRMNEGYKQLNERDFFGVKNIQNFDELLLIDKINLYFKVGFQCGVTFTPEEKQFVNRAERCETVEDVIKLAQEIFAYSKEKAEQEQQQEHQQPSTGDDDGDDYEDSDSDVDGFDEEDGEADEDFQSSNSGAGKNSNKEKDLEAKTDRAFQNKLDDLADDSTDYKYWDFDTDSFEDIVVPYKTILSETLTPDQWDRQLENGEFYDRQTRHMDNSQLNQYRTQLNKEYEMFKAESARTVNYLVKEFEMKKSAQLFKRAQVSKIGSLDMRKVYAYKLKDDLFKRVTTLPQGKNHGMVMLLDWSGSMDNVLQDTLKQVVNLALFCQRVQIPYRVYAFTSSYGNSSMKKISPEDYMDYCKKKNEHRRNKSNLEGNLIQAADDYHLLELFSNKMTTSEFNSMVRRVTDYRFTYNDDYNTGGTPLNEALVWVYKNLGNFIKAHNVEKTTFITLTDGEGNRFSTNKGSYALEDYRSEVVAGVYKRIKQKHFVRDSVTQKTYEITRCATVQQDVMLKMIKDRYDVSVVGFYVCHNSKGALANAAKSNIPNYQGDIQLLIQQWRKDFHQNNFASIKNTARDELFIIPQSSTKIDDGDLEVTAGANAKSIAKGFSKYLNVKKTSRVLLNRFVALVA